MTPMFFAFKERERVLDVIESVTGGRFHPNFNRVGGLFKDIPATFRSECAESMDAVRNVCRQLDDLIVGNEIFMERTIGVGVLPPKLRWTMACRAPISEPPVLQRTSGRPHRIWLTTRSTSRFLPEKMATALTVPGSGCLRLSKALT